MADTQKERRKEARHEIRTDATIQVVRNGEALSGTTRDVSYSGFALMLDQHADMKVGEEVVCEVNIPDISAKPQASWVKGKLVRVSESQAAILLTQGSLKPTLCQPCPCCQGSGLVTSIVTMCFDILTTARKFAASHDSPNVTLSVHPDIANELKTHRAALIEEFEKVTKKSVNLETTTNLHWAQYDIR